MKSAICMITCEFYQNIAAVTDTINVLPKRREVCICTAKLWSISWLLVQTKKWCLGTSFLEDGLKLNRSDLHIGNIGHFRLNIYSGAFNVPTYLSIGAELLHRPELAATVWGLGFCLGYEYMHKRWLDQLYLQTKKLFNTTCDIVRIFHS